MAYASDGGGGGGDSRPPFQRRPDLFSDLMDRSGDNRAALKRLGADDELLDWLYGAEGGGYSDVGASAPRPQMTLGGGVEMDRANPFQSAIAGANWSNVPGFQAWAQQQKDSPFSKAVAEGQRQGATSKDDLEKIFALFGLKR